MKKQKNIFIFGILLLLLFIINISPINNMENNNYVINNVKNNPEISSYNSLLIVEDDPTNDELIFVGDQQDFKLASFEVEDDCILTDITVNLTLTSTTITVSVYLLASKWNVSESRSEPDMISEVDGKSNLLGTISVTSSDIYTLSSLSETLDNSLTENNTWFIGLSRNVNPISDLGWASISDGVTGDNDDESQVFNYHTFTGWSYHDSDVYLNLNLLKSGFETTIIIEDDYGGETLTWEDSKEAEMFASSIDLTNILILDNISVNLTTTRPVTDFNIEFYITNSTWDSINSRSSLPYSNIVNLIGDAYKLGEIAITSSTTDVFTLSNLNYLIDNTLTENGTWFIALRPDEDIGFGNVEWQAVQDGVAGDNDDESTVYNIGVSSSVIQLYDVELSIDVIQQYLELSDSITINELLQTNTTTSGNWSWAINSGYCSGSGTFEDPYILKDLIIDGLNTNQYCLYMLNIRSYWRLQDSILKNGIVGSGKALLMLQNTTNGIVTENTIQDSTGMGIILASASNLTIQQNTITNVSDFGGIFLYGDNENNSITLNTITDSSYGILHLDNKDNSISFNTITNCSQASIVLTQSNTTLVFNNTFESSSAGVIITDNSYNNTLYNNNFRYNDLSLGIQEISYNNSLYQNYFYSSAPLDNCTENLWFNQSLQRGNYYYDYVGRDANEDGIGDQPYYINDTTPTIDYYPIWSDGFLLNLPDPIEIDEIATGINAHNWTWALEQFWCSGSGTFGDPYVIEDIEINSNGLPNCSISILNARSYWQIKNSEFYNAVCDFGLISILNSTNGLISSNYVHDSTGTGIILSLSHNITIYNNTVYNTSDAGGIVLYQYAENNTISYNDIYNSTSGIILYGNLGNNISYNNVLFNEISNSSIGGIALINGTDSNIYNNTISNSPIGICGLGNSENNYIFNNEIQDSNDKAICLDTNTIGNSLWNNYIYSDVEDNSTDNIWYNTTLELGNYYSDYDGYDVDDNSIGDTPYIINITNSILDNFPIWNDLVLDNPIISIISNTTSSVQLSWIAISGADNYSVYYYTSYITEINSSVILFGIVDGITVNITGLTNNTKYYFIVSARSLESNTSISNVVNQITGQIIEDEPGTSLSSGIIWTIVIISLISISIISILLIRSWTRNNCDNPAVSQSLKNTFCPK